MNRRIASGLAWALWSLALLLCIGYIPLRLCRYLVATTPGNTLPPLAVAPSVNTLPWVIADLATVAAGQVFATLGALIVSRQPGNRIGWLYCEIGLVAAIDAFSGAYAIVALLVTPGALPAGLALAWIQTWTWILLSGLGFVFVPLLYPTGRLRSRRWRPVALFAIGLLGGGSLLVAVAPKPLGNHLLDFQVSLANPLGIAALGPVVAVLAPIASLLLLLLTLLAAVSLLLRLRRSRGDEREQLKWFAYVAAMMVTVFVAVNLLYFFLPGTAVTLTVEAAANLVGPVILALLPLLTGLAILRYHLWDIDVIIRRTLVYGTLTAVLGALYLGIVIGAQAVVRPLTGQHGQQPLVIVATTLLIAALFNPLRRGVQAAIDRGFYRRKYDAARALHALGVTLRGAVELNELSARMLMIVQETMQPAHISLWLRPPERQLQGEQPEVPRLDGAAPTAPHALVGGEP